MWRPIVACGDYAIVFSDYRSITFFHAIWAWSCQLSKSHKVCVKRRPHQLLISEPKWTKLFVKSLNGFFAIVEFAFYQTLILWIRRIKLEVHVVELDHIIKLYKLWQRVVTLVIIFWFKVFVPVYYWAVDFVCYVVEAGNAMLNFLCRAQRIDDKIFAPACG